MKYTSESWIKEAKKANPDFDYSESHYIDSYHKVYVRCTKHNLSFEVPPISFLKEKCNNCPGCNPKKKEKSKPPLRSYNKYYEYLVTYTQENISFIKVSSRESDSFSGFGFVLIGEIEDIDKYRSSHSRFYLPEYVKFNGGELFECDGYEQLKATQVKFIRDSILVKQNNICVLCRHDVELPVLDHYHCKKQHGSGLVRGVLCNTCNRMTGIVENNFPRNGIDYSEGPDFLRRLADYLENKRERYIHPSEKEKQPKLMKSSYNSLVRAVNGKQKIPKFTGRVTKDLEALFVKYCIVPKFKK